MKREVIFILIVVLSLVSLSLIYASEESQVEDAYACLATRINQTGCSALSLEEKAFSSLADGECMNQLSADNSSNRCWPKSGCTVKSTSQAVLALNSRIDTTAAENWILSQTATPQNLEWFLEIEILDTGSASCDITYSGSTYKISIRQDKTIDKSAGGLLTLASDYGNYWLRININLYNKPIDIQCDKEFITTLLFKQKYPPSSTIHVSEYIQHAQGQGKVTETVDSLCFAQSGNCNYEASLWAALVLASVHQDISDFMPYLITMKDDLANKIYIPESFLYYLTGKFREELLVKQKAGGYWSESGSRYYDTALALLPFSYESPTEKENSKTWLLGNQQKTGCWNNGNIRDTAFLLYSIWPKENSLPGICEDDSECPEVSCAYVSCEDRNCVYTDYGCDNNDGCCPDGCDSSNDNDCEVIECRDDSKCPATEYSEVYCLDQGSVYQDVYTWSCDTSINECVQEADEQSVKTCENNDCVDGYCGENVCSIFKPCPDGYDCKDNVCVETQVVECSWLKFCQDGYKCDNNVCVPDIICTSDSDCGTTEESELYCYDEMNVYQTVYSYFCDTSTISGTCESNTEEQSVEICEEGYTTCDRGECINTPPEKCSQINPCPDGEKCDNNGVCVPDIICEDDSWCGETDYSEPYCFDDKNVYQTVYSYFCDTSTISGICESNTDEQSIETCSDSETCEKGECVNIPPEQCGWLNPCQAEGYECKDGVCVSDIICEDDTQCDYPDEICEDGECVVNPNPPCIDSYDCDYYEDCIDGDCIPYECEIDDDCYPGKCVDTYCQPEEILDCEQQGYYCTFQADCDNALGTILQDYFCTGELFGCCDTPPSLKTCDDEGGYLCITSEQDCIGGTYKDVSDAEEGEACCIIGTCEDKTDEDYCEDYSGTCRDVCDTGEEEKSYVCGYEEEICCVAKGGVCNDNGICDSGETKKNCKSDCGGGKGWVFIIILLILIILAVLGIVFRDKLRTQWIKLTDKIGGKKEKKKFEMPMSAHPMPQGRILPRRILPGQSQQPPQSKFPVRGAIVSHPGSQPPSTTVNRGVQPGKPTTTTTTTTQQPPTKKPEEKPKSELDDVLKKLKEMGSK